MRLVRALLAALAGVSLLVLVPAAPAYACSCAGGTTADYLEAADVVLLGTVVDREEPGGLIRSSADPVTFLVEAERAYKGDVSPRQEVLSPVSGASCGLEGVRTGGRYVLFGTRQTLEGRPSDELWAYLCGGSAPATPELIGELEAAAGPGIGIGPTENQPGAGPEYGDAGGEEQVIASPPGTVLAVPVAAASGVALLLLAGALWLRLLLRR